MRGAYGETVGDRVLETEDEKWGTVTEVQLERD